MTKITYFFATISPYTYLAGLRLEKIAAKHRASIEYRPMDLMSVFSRTGGVPPKDRHISRIELRAQELERQAKKLKMKYNLKPSYFPVNMAPSSYAFISALRHGDGDLGALAFGFTKAVWAKTKISLTQTLLVNAWELLDLMGLWLTKICLELPNNTLRIPKKLLLLVLLVPHFILLTLINGSGVKTILRTLI